MWLAAGLCLASALAAALLIEKEIHPPPETEPPRRPSRSSG